jgi:type IV pilus assembly protein PilQ
MIKIKNYFFVIVIACALTSCQSRSVSKKDLKTSGVAIRDEVIKLNRQNPITGAGLSDSTNTKIEKPIIEIKGKDQAVKFIDPDWDDYKISVNLNAVPIRVFYEALQELTGINFILGDEIKGEMSLRINEVNWVEIMSIVMKRQSHLSDVNPTGSVVTVHSAQFLAQQSELIQKALLASSVLAKAYSNLESKTTAIIKLDYAKPDILANQLKEMAATLDGASAQTSGSQKSRATFVVDARTNSLIVQSTDSDLNWIKSAILNLDKPTKQVLVEVYIIEATDDFQSQLGSRIGLYSEQSGRLFASGTVGGAAAKAGDVAINTVSGSLASNPITGVSTLGGLALAFNGANTDLRVQLEAMQRESLIKIVSNPKLFIIDNEQASILDGQEVPYTTTATLGATPTVSFKNASLKLEVRPSVIGDGNIYLDLSVNKDTPLTGTPPAIATKYLKTKLLVKDGGIAMIGGINKSETTASQEGVPFFFQLPIIGNLFRYKKDVNNKNQLYIFLAPRVL